MKAMRLVSGAGGAATLVEENLPQPVPGQGEVLVRVYAAGVTHTELGWYPTLHTKAGEIRSGAVPGHEFSGVVAALGEGVTNFTVGREIYGMNDWFADGATAEFCITQPVFDLKLLEDFLRRIEGFRIPIVAGIWPLTSLRNAEFMKNDLRVSMPDEILARMAAVTDKEAALAEGVAIAREMLESVRGEVQGVQVSAPFGKYAVAVEVLGLTEERV